MTCVSLAGTDCNFAMYASRTHLTYQSILAHAKIHTASFIASASRVLYHVSIRGLKGHRRSCSPSLPEVSRRRAFGLTVLARLGKNSSVQKASSV